MSKYITERAMVVGALFWLSVCAGLLMTTPVRSQDLQPSPHAVRITAFDGKEWAISTFDIFIFGGVGMMMRDPVHPIQGAAYWTVYGEPFRIWQCQTPCGGVPDSQVLSEQIATLGGPAHFVLALMHYANIFLLNYYGFNPSWPPQKSIEYLELSLDAWLMKPFVPELILTQTK